MLPTRVRVGWAVAPALLALAVAASPASADCGNDKPVGRPADECPRATGPEAPSPGATPELDSLVLFGTGLLGAGGYALTRLRAARRRP